ncbi:thiosulfate oxidation carrier complex protein SoxZ [Roseibium aestuarii]|uniref:Thiosulfate oxidation carrier complex protein SoxZ n=1 Tax=Roseibium aestuarii TaxID=2600299 RepID=A0ABW4JYJ9_9HYPH|nr:thiosulfate oxidation carrier complex protein SoxZ [Roseibium aestuarii]
MADNKPRVKVPKKAAKGEVIAIKTLISHPMESGQRKDKAGNLVPRQIINKFTCEFNGQVVFTCDMDPAVSANPYLEFNVRVDEPGTFKFTWVDDDGSIYEAVNSIAVE